MDSPYFVNPAGFTIHSAIHSAREDAQCVLHLHTDDGVAVSAQKDGLQPITQQSMLLTSQEPITIMKVWRLIWMSASG